jgi:iron complex outermembrane receptor protein
LVDYISTNQVDIDFVSEIGSLVPGENYFFATNIADVQIRGVEFESNVQFGLGGDVSLKLHNSLSLIGQSSSLETVSVYLSNTAKVLSTNRVSLNTNRFDINLTGLYKNRNARIAEAIGANISEDFFLVNASAFFKLNNTIKLGAHMINVGDIEYQNILGAPLPGRWFRASVDWAF